MITETKLESWVMSKGVRPVSEELQVTQATIYRWLRGGCPGDRSKIKLCELSGLTIQDIFDHVHHHQYPGNSN